MATVVSVRPSATIYTAGGDEISLQLIEATVETSRHDEAATFELEALADATPGEIRSVETAVSSATVSVNGTQISAGYLSELTVDETGAVTVVGHDAVRQLATNYVGEEYRGVELFTILEDIFEAAGIDPIGENDSPPAGEPAYAPDTDPGTSPDDGDNEDRITTANFTSTSCRDALKQLCEFWGLWWYVDADNIVHIVDAEDGIEGDEHTLQYVTETSDGLQTPPYRRVIVRGGPDTDESGSTSHMFSRNQVQGVAWDEGIDPSAETFVYEDRSITSARVAQNVAEGILREAKRQAQTGEITVVGDPALRPLDVVMLPDSMGGVEYVVGSIVHEISNSDGYVTTIGLSGHVDEIQTRPATTGPDSGTAGTPGDGDGGDDEEDDDDDDDAVPDDGDEGTAPPPDDGDGDDEDDDEDDGETGDGDDGGDDDGGDDDGGSLPDGPRIISP